jgi:hypothetical protein
MTITCLQQTAQNAAVTSNKHSLSDFVQYSKIDSWMNVLNLPVLYQFGSAEAKWFSVGCVRWYQLHYTSMSLKNSVTPVHIVV